MKLEDAVTYELLPEAPQVELFLVGYPAYPYDNFLLVRLPGGKAFVYRWESDDWLIWEGTIPFDVRPDHFLWPLIDAMCRHKLTRLTDANVERLS